MAQIADALDYVYVGNITACSVATTTAATTANFTGGDYVVTAITDTKRAFKVIGWNVGEPSSGLVRNGEAADGTESTRNIAITGLDPNRVATAHVDGGGALRVGVWVVGAEEFPGGGDVGLSANPIVWFQNGAAGGAATQVSIAALNSKEVVTAVRDGSGNLRVDAWTVAPGLSSGGTGAGLLEANGSHTAGPVSDVAIAAASSNQVVTAVRNASGNLELIAWQIGKGKVVRQGNFEAGAVSQVAITKGGAVDLLGAAVTTAFVNSKGNLELTLWTVSTSGSISRGANMTGQPATQVDVCALPLSIGFSAITTAQYEDRSLDIAAWNYDDGGKVITRSVLTDGVTAGTVSLLGYDSGEHVYFATAAQLLSNPANGDNQMEVAVRMITP